MKVKSAILNILIIANTSILVAQPMDSISIKTIEWELGYTCDAGRNFTGGLAVGNVYMGLLTASITLHSDKIWKGGSLNFSLLNTHGHNLTENFVGDNQVISNIECGNYPLIIGNLYYRQDISKFSILIGLQNLNDVHCANEYGRTLTNSSFGIHSTFSLNFGAALYPKNALGITLLYDITNRFKFRTALFDGDAGSLDEDPYNVDWSLTKHGGVISISELEYNSKKEGAFVINVGGLYHSGQFIYPDDTLQSSYGDWGLFTTINNLVLKKGTFILETFGQISYFPAEVNYNTLYLGGGVTMFGIFKKRAKDCLSSGAAYSLLYDNTYECDLELNYLFAFGNHVSIQPVLHYVIHPGANQGLDNAFAGFIRLSITIP
jgi:carbohydrate-selective porin OprB